MKKLICLIMSVACLWVTATLFSCGGYPKPETIVYTSEILINEESFPSDLVWYGYLKGPANGDGILPVDPYHTYATIGADGICEIQMQREGKTLQGLLGLTDEDYAREFGRLSKHEHRKYADTELIIFQVDVNAENNGQPVTHAGKNMIAERCGESVYLIDVTEIFQSSGALFASNEGRIGAKYYFEYGYYDLNTHEVKAYTQESELPPAKHEAFSVIDYHPLMSFLRKHEIGSAYFEDMYCEGAYQLGNRLYAVMTSLNRYHNGIDENGNYIYEGDDIYLVTLDTETDRILYLNKYHLADYWGENFGLFQKGSDGELLTPMTADT